MAKPFAHLAVVLAALGLAPWTGAAHSVSAVSPEPGADDMPMADYLGLLAQIAPAAQDGARAYLNGFQQRCGRPLRSAELRRAMSEGDGDPILMRMIRASQLGDATALGQLAQRIECERRAAQ